MSYGSVAKHAGLGRAARQVSRALKQSQSNKDLPWFRIVRADGKLGFPPDSDPYTQQRERLESEGVVFINARINMKLFAWQPDLDALIWGH